MPPAEAAQASARATALRKQVKDLDKSLRTAHQELHASADGHNDINSTFPTATEIQQKVRPSSHGFVNSVDKPLK